MKILWGWVASLVAFSAWAQPVHDHGQNGGLSALLFPHAIFGAYTGALKPAAAGSLDSYGRELAASAFVSYDGERFRFLGEFLFSNFEKEAERLQLGIKLDPRNTLWVGRFHSPAGVWNYEHHHGAYLQTSISRPAIVSYEDGGGGLPTSGGVLPMHLLGVLWEGSRAMGVGAVNYEVGFARGPSLADGLQPYPLFAPAVPGREAFAARVGYRPDETSGTQAGLFATRVDIPLTIAPGGDLSMSVAGLYGQWSFSSGRVFGEWFDVKHRSSLGGMPGEDSFTAGFVQGESQVAEAVTLFARAERLTSSPADPYLALFPNFPKSTDVVGVRWDFARKHALTLEIANNVRRDQTVFGQTVLQWSAIIP
jgi:hypothetical protein